MDRLTKLQRSRLMSRIRGRDTLPELAVRKIVRGLGRRPTLNAPNVVGKPDLAWVRRKCAIFVHGCFWHRHPGCRYATTPKSKTAYWNAKFAANVSRDRRVQRKLRMDGWRILVVWQCQTKRADSLARRIERFISE